MSEHDEVADRYIYRPLAAALVPALARARVAPVHVTGVSLILVLIACLSIAFTRPLTAGALLFLSVVLDCADGQLARLLHCASIEGSMYDHISDDCKVASLAAAVVAAHRAHITSVLFATAVFGALSLVAVAAQSFAFTQSHRNGILKEMAATLRLRRRATCAPIRAATVYYLLRLRVIAALSAQAGIPLTRTAARALAARRGGTAAMLFWRTVGPSSMATLMVVLLMRGSGPDLFTAVSLAGPALLLTGALAGGERSFLRRSRAPTLGEGN